MKIAINCWILRNKNVDGIGNFCIETVREMVLQHPKDLFLLLCDKNFTEDYFNFPNVKVYKILPPYRHPVLYVWYMQTTVKNFLNQHKPDVFIGIEGFLSLGAQVKQIPVIHDLNFEHYPKDLPFRNRFYYKNFMPLFAKKANRIATVSEFTKHDIIENYGIEADKIDVVYCGIKEKFRQLSLEEIQAIRKNATNGKPYFFFIGSMHPRKNLLRLIEAFDIFKNENPRFDHQLVLAGSILWDNKMFDKILNKIRCKNDIIFTGRISDEKLTGLLGAATALTFIPTFEGFGIPIVDAFQSGIPVICSNVTSMPEVAAGAALLVDPFNTFAIAEAMKEIVINEKLRIELIEKGSKRKSFFSWKKTAEILYECILKTVSQSH